ncbi:hypothetical protein [Sediminibacterium sp.]|uniref:hypothetical protein n=1 Tax=Sediminibacterium sp. TaxID=1917865 RepID=UPI0025F5EC2A|nr:hypothetical protein [Sediminibacterium sp.]MBW0177565.1 hypothetical protein [Sediminibacterium sp.]
MNTDLLELVKVVVTVIIAVVGWRIGHYYNSQRDKHNKRREIRLEHLINAYRILTNEISHRKQTKEREQKLEAIISEIQLFGSVEQAQIAKQLARDIAAKKDYEYDTLINSLRSDLRKQLDVPHIEGNVTWLRFEE